MSDCEARMRTNEGIRLRCDQQQHGDEEHRWVLDGGASVSAVITRADGTVEDLGVIGEAQATWQAN